ncbi:MAG: N-acetyl-1-D-myo-inositol-2-amino-2-deoxy-alpha-D-glucopyranoside deacetylase [Corynebacterium sp.]|uniref:N-acetyl-1-D-myo-inositol-2-amino-2-deoxy-alpha- D-glucopyranoside deacetylase n=1 Tax=Corynebacterium sp. TaxID=1720 RepID=UPI0026DAC680|nr:N-acetyl-1-D-myo-inositol-2-amino-2-deoxy-alpha-D-glucopyranoside deacetylase [Corynebacterium sp.]MDO5029475.1 N-acetyl-1-D-myo-inositol-2-amino-2-deoxy-alpha-D-glucopyranoside deacetylase [Corynebacterium sp.]
MKLLFVHAHPDDESIWTGGLMAAAARAGASVSVVTCTMGELGEVIGAPYQGLVADEADQLGGFRVAELRSALRALGANGPDNTPRFLGGAGRWRDSGMAGDKGNDHPRAFVNSDEEAVNQLREILEELQPDLVITYDADGGYGHPDHIRAHDITVAACGDRFPTLWAVTDREAMAAGLDAITVVPEGWQESGVDDFATVTGQIEVVLDDAAVAAKVEAMRAHATQVWIADGSVSEVNPVAVYGQADDSGNARAVWAFSNLLCQPVMPTEAYRFGTATPETLKPLAELINLKVTDASVTDG